MLGLVTLLTSEPEEDADCSAGLEGGASRDGREDIVVGAVRYFVSWSERNAMVGNVRCGFVVLW